MSTPAPGFRSEYDKFYINGQWIASTGGLDAVINPANESVIGHVPAGTVQDCERALAAARGAFDDGPWPNEHRNVRADRIGKLIELCDRRREEILALHVVENGFPRWAAEFLYALARTQMVKFSEVARRDPTRPLPIITTPQADGTKKLGGAILTRDPIGVVSAITPYNAGFLLGMMKTVPALLAGDTVVLKPSPWTPLQTMLICELMAELDLPPGVFNAVNGGPDVGAKMGSDPRVDMISFTGSDKIGEIVMAQAAPTLKKVHLELGGKSALILRHDADLALAVQQAIGGCLTMGGQGCSLTTRILVSNRIRPDFVAALKAGIAQLKVGDPAEPDTFMGPLIRPAAVERSEMFCRRALEEGAALVTGGKRPEHLKKGFYFAPTIFDNVRHDSHLGQNEVFGPIGAVMGFDTDAEAVKIANGTDFGLGGAIISRDAGTAMEMALKIRTGQIAINGGAGGLHPDTPFGGYKRSGLGREWGEEGYYEFTEMKAITFPAG
ncbi:MAG: aldehyde dehydrogenase family protein [Gammaproteobacteria bacterium]